MHVAIISAQNIKDLNKTGKVKQPKKTLKKLNEHKIQERPKLL